MGAARSAPPVSGREPSSLHTQRRKCAGLSQSAAVDFSIQCLLGVAEYHGRGCTGFCSLSCPAIRQWTNSPGLVCSYWARRAFTLYTSTFYGTYPHHELHDPI